VPLFAGVEPWMKSRANSDTEIASQLWRQSRIHGSVALRAEADEILFRIFALAAPALNVMGSTFFSANWAVSQTCSVPSTGPL